MGPVLIGLFVIVFLALVVIALRRPLLARLAFREAGRRPWQSVLVVAGLTVGTSMILMALVNGESMSLTLSSATYKSWGRVDILASNSGNLFSPDLASSVAADPRLHGKVRGVQAGVEVFASVADLDRTLDNPAVRVIGFDPVTQPAFGAFTLGNGRSTFGQDLSAGEVLLSKSLADSLQALPGDRLKVTLSQNPPADYTVAGIARPDGPGAYGARPALFGTLQAMAALIGSDSINVLRISALGDGSNELDNSKNIAPLVVSALRDLPAGTGLQVRTVKADDVNEVIKLSNDNTPIVMALSVIVVLAGIALVVNLSLALSEERRPRLAILRALGLSRSGLIVTAVLEGAVYSLAAAAIGALPGIALGWLFVSQAGKWVPEIHEKDASVIFVVSAQAIAVSIAAGTLITLTTLLIATIRTSRMSIASAVRALPDPHARRRPSRIGTWGIVTIGVAGLTAVVLGNTLLRLLGGLVAIAFVGLVLRGRMSNRWRATLVGLAATAWLLGLYSTTGVDELTTVTGTYITLLTVASTIAALSVVVAVNMRLVERFVPRSLVAQLTRHPSRLSLATGAVGLVLAMLAFIGVFIASTIPDYRRDAGGYDVSVVSTGGSSVRLPTALQAKVESDMSIATRTYFGPVRSSTSPSGAGPVDWHQQLLPLYELSPAQLSEANLPFADRDARFSSDAAAWSAIRADPSWIASGAYTGGSTVTMIGSNGPVNLRVAGHFRAGFLAGLIGSSGSMAPFSSAQIGTTLLLKLKPGVDPTTFALDVRRSLFPTGVEAVTTRAQLDAGYALIGNFVAEVELMLTAGLAVGVLSLGMLALRAVVDRRRSIGMLRAIGFQSRHLLIAVMGESLLMATGGIVVGLFAGLTLGLIFIQQYVPGGRVGVQAGNLVIAVVLIYLTAAAVTVAPALAMARTAPAEALRIID